MKKILLLTSCLLLAVHSARADYSLIFTPTSSPNVLPGGQVSFDISVSVSSANNGPVDVTGFSLWFETSAINNSFFSIAGVNRGASPFSFATGSPIGDAIVSGGNQDDIGAIVPAADGGSVPTNATYFLATLTIQINGITPTGSYAITSVTLNSPTGQFHSTGDVGSEVADSFTDFFFPPTSFIINVVPEPTTWSLIALGGLGALGLNLLRARRKS